MLGLIAMVLLMQVDYRRYNNPEGGVSGGCGDDAAAGRRVCDARTRMATHRWIRFGGLFTFQPSELAKPVLVLFLAYFLQTRMHAMDDWKGTILRAAAVRWLFIGADFEGAGSGHGAGVRGGDGADAVSGGGADEVLRDWRCVSPRRCCTSCCSMWRSGARACWRSSIRRLDPQGDGLPHHAVADRGRHGRDSRAWADGRAAEAVLSAGAAYRLHLREYLRGAWADWRAAACWRCSACWGIAGCGRRFCRPIRLRGFWRSGITTAILIQAFFNMSVVLALLPTKGIPLPFISFGGTSLFITLASMGVLLNITREID